MSFIKNFLYDTPLVIYGHSRSCFAFDSLYKKGCDLKVAALSKARLLHSYLKGSEATGLMPHGSEVSSAYF